MSPRKLFDEDTPRWAKASAAALTVMAVAAVAVTALLIFGVPLSFGGGSGTAEPATTAPQALPSSETPEHPVSGASICGLPDGVTGIPEVAPEATWSLVGSMMMPASPTHGPGRTAGGRKCFAHSTLGAVLYAFNASDGNPGGNPNGLQFAGFRVTEASRDRVDLDMAFRITQGDKAGVIFSAPGVVVWRDGDWADATGDVKPTVLASLAGYVPFGPGGS